jgi:predicted PurR-regulated permease PerM
MDASRTDDDHRHRANLLGSFVTGAIQSLITVVFLVVLGVPHAWLWATLAFVLSFLPMIGTTPIAVGAALYLFASDRVGAGIAMLVGALVVGLSDDFVRPWVTSSQFDMHPVLVLLSIFGGLAAMGPAGVLLGPILAAVAIWCVEAIGASGLPPSATATSPR